MKTQKRRTRPTRSGRRKSASRPVGGGIGSRLVIMLAVVAAVVFGVAIFFKIHDIQVQGNRLYSADEIRAASGIEVGDNLFTLNKEEAAGNIKAKLPYVEDVSVIRFLPDIIAIEVKESEATFAVATDLGTTWLINTVGKALEPLDTPLPDDSDETADGEQAKNVPAQIHGLSVHRPTVGAVVTSEQPAALQAALAVLAELNGTGILEHIVEIDVEKEYDIVLQYEDQYEILLGGTEDLEYKVEYLTVILSQLSSYQAGTIDLSFAESSEARFYSRE